MEDYINDTVSLTPIILVILFWVVGLLYIFLQYKFIVGALKMNSDKNETLSKVRVISIVAIALLGAIPIISLIALIMIIL